MVAPFLRIIEITKCKFQTAFQGLAEVLEDVHFVQAKFSYTGDNEDEVVIFAVIKICAEVILTSKINICGINILLHLKIIL